MGLASNDIKRILAYSTVSQLGYMMLALGAGSLAAGMFHLFTHAFFKALLFLAAGSVIHAVGTNDITEMGGLRKYMPRTYWTMAIGGLSLAGLPAVLGLLVEGRGPRPPPRSAAGPILLAFGVITVFLTAFYTFRMFFLTFHGSFRGPSPPRRRPPERSTPKRTQAAARVRLVDDRPADRPGDPGRAHRLLGLARSSTTASSASWKAPAIARFAPNLLLAVGRRRARHRRASSPPG